MGKKHWPFVDCEAFALTYRGVIMEHTIRRSHQAVDQKKPDDSDYRIVKVRVTVEERSHAD